MSVGLCVCVSVRRVRVSKVCKCEKERCTVLCVRCVCVLVCVRVKRVCVGVIYNIIYIHIYIYTLVAK